MRVRFMKPGEEGRRKFIHRDTDVIPAKGRTVKWGDNSYTVESITYDLNKTPGAAPAGELEATVYLV